MANIHPIIAENIPMPIRDPSTTIAIITPNRNPIEVIQIIIATHKR